MPGHFPHAIICSNLWKKVQQQLWLTCAHLQTGLFAHVSQLNDDVVPPTWLQLLDGIFHSAVASLHFVDPVRFSDQVFHCYSIELREAKLYTVTTFFCPTSECLKAKYETSIHWSEGMRLGRTVAGILFLANIP